MLQPTTAQERFNHDMDMGKFFSGKFVYCDRFLGTNEYNQI